MNHCENCGVELDESMNSCPLCGKAVNETFGGDKKSTNIQSGRQTGTSKIFSKKQTKIIWEVVTLVISALTVVPLVINYIIDKQITWAQYPATICLLIFLYTSLIAFWKHDFILVIGVSCLMSSAVLLILDFFNQRIDWPINIALPILLFANLILITLILVSRHIKHKGINLISYILLGIGVFNIGIEMIISFYWDKNIHLGWSLIVFATILITSLTLLYMHIFLKKGRDLNRTFHI